MRIRVFIAVELEEGLKGELGSLQRELACSRVDAKWTLPEGLHITLKFLGEITLQQLEQVKEVIAKVADEFTAFSAEFVGIGAFPNLSRPRVLWVGVGEGADELSKIAERLEEELEKIGFERESRKFHPHVTLARFRSLKNIDKLNTCLKEHVDKRFGDMKVGYISLMKSQLLRTGAVYTCLVKAPLIGGEVCGEEGE